ELATKKSDDTLRTKWGVKLWCLLDPSQMTGPEANHVASQAFRLTRIRDRRGVLLATENSVQHRSTSMYGKHVRALLSSPVGLGWRKDAISLLLRLAVLGNHLVSSLPMTLPLWESLSSMKRKGDQPTPTTTSRL
ncbi:hypothetical protein Hamer_G006180, partial [Homarus americanus]